MVADITNRVNSLYVIYLIKSQPDRRSLYTIQPGKILYVCTISKVSIP